MVYESCEKEWRSRSKAWESEKDPPGLYGPQKGQVGWLGYLSPKSGSPASILGSPAIYSKKAKRFFFPLFMLVIVLMLFSSIFKVACLRNAIFFFFSLPFCWILLGNFPRIQVVQRDYLNPTLGSLTGLFLEFRSPGRWDYAICWALPSWNFQINNWKLKEIPYKLFWC